MPSWEPQCQRLRLADFLSGRQLVFQTRPGSIPPCKGYFHRARGPPFMRGQHPRLLLVNGPRAHPCRRWRGEDGAARGGQPPKLRSRCSFAVQCVWRRRQNRRIMPSSITPGRLSGSPKQTWTPLRPRHRKRANRSFFTLDRSLTRGWPTRGLYCSTCLLRQVADRPKAGHCKMQLPRSFWCRTLRHPPSLHAVSHHHPPIHLRQSLRRRRRFRRRWHCDNRGACPRLNPRSVPAPP
jgi:hypothetical protein